MHRSMQPDKTIRQSMRIISGLLCKTAAVLVLITVALMLLLRWIAPPTSAFMLRQRLVGTPIDYRWVPLNRISPDAALAVIASEDQNFFNHWGLDLDAITHAIQENESRSRPRGASTISQQVAKNLFLWPGRSYLRKGIEVYFTLLMELVWSKQRILEVYLNIIELGHGVFGVEAAAHRFFGTSADRLSKVQAATLAAVLPSPKRMSAGQPSYYVRYRCWQIMEQMDALGGRAFLEAAGW